MFALLNALLGVMLTALVLPADAFWRMSCGRIQMGRVDPIITPGGISGHAHTISGPINFNTTSTFESLQSAYCTSCGIQDDKSAYWTPQLYYRYRNGSYTEVPNGGTVVYYLSRGDAELQMEPFPNNYRILAGDSGVRSYDTTKMTYGGNATKKYNNRPIADRVSFACLNYNKPTPETPRLASTDCPGGLRAQVHLPSCWDGKNVYKSDQSHAAYMSGIDTGVCPPTHPRVLPHLFIEVIYSTNNVGQEKGGYFVFANGDTTGYGFHADFLNGWKPQVMADAIKQCMGTGRAINEGDIEKCPPLKKSFDPFFNKNCPEQAPLVKEPVKGLLKVLPGCNPPTGGPARAAQNICPVQPGLNDVDNTDDIIRVNPQPGDKVGDFEHIGCADDKGSPKTLTGDYYQDSSGLTIQQCTSYCKKNGWAYAGVENGYQCYCGNAFMNPLLSPAACAAQPQIVCNGNSLQYCGGQNLVHIYNDTKTTVKVRGLPVATTTRLGLKDMDDAIYAGCYPEPSSGKMLTGASFSNNTGMTNEMCARFCAKGGFKVFGTEYASECYCGQAVSTSPVGQTNCSFICKGDKTQFCGAGGKLSLWSFGFNSVPTISAGPTATTATTATTAAAISVPPATSIALLGCWKEFINPRALNDDFTEDPINMSVDLCAQRAQKLNYRLFGLEYGQQCLMGDYNQDFQSVQTDDSKCFMPCKGKPLQTCGGDRTMSYYNNTAYKPRIPPTISLPAQGASFTYKGCYNKTATGPVLPGGTLISDKTISIDTCAAFCLSKGFSWFGVEYGQECSCNNAGMVTGASLSKKGDQDCNFRCAGKETQNCGAASRIEVYQKASGSSRIVGKRRNMFGGAVEDSY